MRNSNELEHRVEALEQKMTELLEVVRPKEITPKELVEQCVNQALHSEIPHPHIELHSIDSITRR